MLRNKKSQQNNEEEQNAKNVKNLKLLKVKKKGLVLLASLALLVAVLIAGTVAWYTRVSQVTSLGFDVAKFDFNAGYAINDFDVDVMDLINVTDGMAVPGSRGIIPLKMTATDSDADATYSLGLNFNEVDDRFKERIRFYYYTKATGSDGQPVPVLHVINPAESTQTSNYIKGTVKRGHVDPREEDPSWEWHVKDYEKFNYEFIYWEWIYDLTAEDLTPEEQEKQWFYYQGYWYQRTSEPISDDDWAARQLPSDIPRTGKGLFEYLYGDPEVRSQAKDAHDDFDTKIGTGKYNQTFDAVINGQAKRFNAIMDGQVIKTPAYQQAMLAKFYLTGAQARPIKEREIDTHKVEYNPDAGTVYVDEDTMTIIDNADRNGVLH